MNEKKIMTCFVLLIFIISCTTDSIEVINDQISRNKDAFSLKKSDTIKTIFIGKRINPNPLVSQIFHKGERLDYILLDENQLYFFDFFSGKLKSIIKIKTSSDNGCGRLNNYSGFLYHSQDSIFIYNYKLKQVFLIDSISDIINKWKITNKRLAKYPVDAEALTSSPIIYSNGCLVLSGSGLGQPDDATSKNKPVSSLINLKDNQLKYIVGYPEQYRKGNFGGVHFNTIYHSIGRDNTILYSFPADHYLYQYSIKRSKLNKIYAGSRYIKSIKSSTLSEMDIFIDKNKRIKYFVAEPSYGRIVYDKYRDIYYRFAYHPLKNWTPKQATFKKPFSIIVLNKNGEEICETDIFTNPDYYNIYNCHVVPDGLIIQKATKNENIIEFEIFILQSK